MKRTSPLLDAELRRVLGPDLRLALVVTVLMVVGFGVSLEDDFRVAVREMQWPRPELLGIVLVLGQSLALTFRRVAAVSVLVLTAVASIGYQAFEQRPVPLMIGLLVALYTVAVVRRPLVSGIGAALFLVACTAGALTGWAPLSDEQYYTILVSVVGAVMVGYGVALSRARAAIAEESSAQLARDQGARTRAAVAEEQARIAREVHDIVAHDVSVIVAQAAAARRVFADRPSVAQNALASIEEVGRDALDGLRRLVPLLRTAADDPDRAPQPSLDQLPWLLDQVTRAGLPVDLVVRGRPGPLPATVELNAYRIVQESLTNILKHAGPTRATVVLEYADDTLTVQVTDLGRGRGGMDEPAALTGDPAERRAAGERPGYGLIGMQQRAAMLGGDLVAGPGEDRGFRVAARLPVAGGPE
jgi:signal transduction histidine kinase